VIAVSHWTRHIAVAALVASSALAGGCGGKSSADAEPPLKVPAAIVPAALSGGIELHENTDDETLKAFANGGKLSLVADARLWELRQGTRLVGALQVATFVRRVDLTKADARKSMLRQVLPGDLNQLNIDEVPVWAVESNDKVVYMWFASHMFEVLQLKGSQLQPESILREVVGHEKQSDEFLPLPPEAYSEED
jgi:hypothetical protein